MNNFSIPSLVLLFGLLLAAGIILLRTAKKRQLHNQNHQAAWLERLKSHLNSSSKATPNSEELENHIKNLTKESNALLTQLGHDKSKKIH